mmetsp:Transcript_31896/g.88165  ORF Transcript_31896/g.88165 Transcript_31896/m.88165 type:complete len:262 (+) Transcript_31896:275-1060(+)
MRPRSLQIRGRPRLFAVPRKGPALVPAGEVPRSRRVDAAAPLVEVVLDVTLFRWAQPPIVQDGVHLQRTPELVHEGLNFRQLVQQLATLQAAPDILHQHLQMVHDVDLWLRGTCRVQLLFELLHPRFHLHLSLNVLRHRVGVLLFVNLLCSHLIRAREQQRGTKVHAYVAARLSAPFAALSPRALGSLQLLHSGRQKAGHFNGPQYLLQFLAEMFCGECGHPGRLGRRFRPLHRRSTFGAGARCGRNGCASTGLASACRGR